MGEASNLYGRDFYAWAVDQAEKLRGWPEHLRPNGIDIDNLAEEVESLAKREARRFESLLERIFLHLLKMQWHPDQGTRAHWLVEVNAWRRRLADVRSDEPALWSRRAEFERRAWAKARAEFRDRLNAEGHDQNFASFDVLGGDEGRPPFDLDRETLHVGWSPNFQGTAIAAPGPERRRRKPRG